MDNLRISILLSGALIIMFTKVRYSGRGSIVLLFPLLIVLKVTALATLIYFLVLPIISHLCPCVF